MIENNIDTNKVQDKLPKTDFSEGDDALRTDSRLGQFFEGIDPDSLEITEGGEPILSGEDFVARATELGYGNGRRGTYSNGESYLYIKHGNEIAEREGIDSALATARELTELGAIHPESEWGVIRNDHSYQLFVISPQLDAWTLEGAVSGVQDSLRSGDHITAWLKSVDSRYVPDEPLPDDSLIHYLNQHEASHPDNWGWDEHGRLYPLDVEVINLSGHAYKFADHDLDTID